MTINSDAKVVMLEHSEVKVSLYGTYLATYLNILSRVSSVKRIFLFDLMCGEGIYENGGKGSPIVAAEVIKNHYFANNQSCPNMTVWFNDSAMSKIEKGILKIGRVKNLVDHVHLPRNVTIEYFTEAYDQVHARALHLTRGTVNSKSLFFIDPYGYKDVTPSHIKETLEGGNSEVLLFLPVSYMYRFAAKVMETSFPGSAPLENFLKELFGTKQPTFQSVFDFIEQAKAQFRLFLSQMRVFVDTFTIERDDSNVYCLFFFTSHIRGYEKMLEAKWALDTESGQGFRLQKGPQLFSAIELAGYPDKLYNFINSVDFRRNDEIHMFGLQNGFLPKHSNSILREWLETRANFERYALDNKPLRGNATYIDNKERSVAFRFHH
jgi:three-Cys-motif partner protein